jgi:hypothetical protein
MTEEYYDLTLTKDGKMIQQKWVYDHEIEKGEYISRDVSDNFVCLLGKTVKIEPGFTLDHLFALVSGDHEVYNIIMQDCFITPFIEEWRRIKPTYVPPEYKYDPDGIEYLNLYWHAEMQDGFLEGVDRPDFGGTGWELKEDKFEEWDKDSPTRKKGTRISWGIDFSSLQNLLHLPIVADDKMEIREDMMFWKKEDGPEIKILLTCKKKYTLKDIIEGVFWELSFYGTPEEKEEQCEKITKIHEEVKEAIASGDMSKFVEFDPKSLEGE